MMKILTVNVHGWIEEDSLNKIKTLAQVIAKKDYEIVALQEVNQPLNEQVTDHPRFVPSTNEDNPIQLKEQNYTGVLIQELEKLGKKYYWSWSANHIGYDKYDEGLSTLSKTPQKAEAITVSDTTAYDSISTRNVLKSKMLVNGEEWGVFNGHFSWWKNQDNQLVFKNEWDNMKKHFKNLQKDRVIFMGDFNNEADLSNKGYDYILKTAPFLNDSYTVAKKKYGNATMAAGIDGWQGSSIGKRIDYIFVSKRLTIIENNVIFDGKNEPIISDHFGVEVTIENN